MKNNNFSWKAASVVIAIIVISAGVVATWATSTANQTNLKEDVIELKEDGCDKSDQNEKDILVMQTDITYIKDGVKTLLEKE